MFSIRQMIELTGLSEFTIRGWENRYKAFCPERSDTGRREYHKKDIEKALLLRELLKRGHKISKIATLSNPKLQSLFEVFEEKHQTSNSKQDYKVVSEILELMALQKWTDLSDLFKNAKYKNTSDLVHHFFLPLLRGLAEQIASDLVSIAQEHILSSLIKEKIYSELSTLENKRKAKNSKGAIRFVLATPEGDYHEIGLLLAHLLIRNFGHTSLFLGPNSPAHDLSETALRFEATHLLIVSTVSKKEGARHHILNFVSEVQKRMGPDFKILLAGGQAPHIPQEQNSTLTQIENFFDFENYLKSIGGKL